MGKQVVVTDATGTYWIPQLPPGVYTLSFAAAEYQPDSCPDIALNVDQTVRIDVSVVPESVLPMFGKWVPCNSPQR